MEIIYKLIDTLTRFFQKTKSVPIQYFSSHNQKYGKSVLIGAIFILSFLFLLCGFFIGNQDPHEESASELPALSITEIASTIYAQITKDKLLSASSTNTPNTPSPEPTITPSKTPDPIQLLFEKYPCLAQNKDISYGKVVEIIDGTSIIVEIGSELFPVSYVGIDCPQCKDPEQIEFFGVEALDVNRNLVEGEEVILIRDSSETDQSNHLLRYVIKTDGDIFINYLLVFQGYAQASSNNVDIACSNLFTEAQNHANTYSLGFWSEAIVPPTATEPTSDPRAGCDPCYPSVCIPDVSYDLDCKDIPFRRFSVPNCDPHGFDGDNDGIGCESG